MKFHLIFILFVFSMAACKKDAPVTTPEEEPQPVEETKTAEPRLVPLEHFDRVDAIWQTALSAVVNCVQKRIDATNQKGLQGYLIIEADIGLKPNPINIRIKEQQLKIDQIETCIVEYLSQMEFPTWGYWAKSQYSFSINVGY